MSNLVTPTYLAIQNPHPRDEHISFEEGPHIYTVLGDRGGYTSVTTWNHSHFSHFDADGTIDKMMKSKTWNTPSHKYYGMTREEIKEQWNKNGQVSSGSGTKMHYDIECYYNKMEFQNDSIEFQYFMQFTKDFPDLTPYRTEWMIYHEDFKLSGSIDMIYENPDGTLQIYDWKRCKEIQHETNFGKYALTTCISHLPDTNFWHYALQLNTYKMILEQKYGKKVTGLYLMCLHPDNVYKTYERIQVPFLDKEIDNLMKYRVEMLNKNIKVISDDKQH